MSLLMSPDMAEDDLYSLSGLENPDVDSLNYIPSDRNVSNFDNNNFYAPFSFKDIEENIGTITSLESRITDLLYLADDIRNAKGMNQSFALEAERIVPGFNKVPLGYYSKDTSATRFKVSLEDISKGVWAMIIAGVLAVIALIGKIAFHLFGVGDGGGSGGGGGSNKPTIIEVKAKLEEVVAAATESAEIIKDIVREKIEIVPEVVVATAEDKTTAVVTDTSVIKEVTLDELFEKYVSKEGDNSDLAVALWQKNPLLQDLLDDGPYSKEVKKLYINGDLKAITTILKHLASSIKTFSNPSLDVINEGADEDYEKLLIAVTDYSNHDANTLFGKIDTAKAKSVEKYSSTRYIKLSDLYNTYTKTVEEVGVMELIDDIMAVKLISEELDSELANYLDAAKKIETSTDGAEPGKATEYAKRINTIISKLTSYLKIVTRIANIVTGLASLLLDLGEKLSTTIPKQAEKVCKKVVSESKTTMNPVIKKALNTASGSTNDSVPKKPMFNAYARDEHGRTVFDSDGNKIKY
jgi:hypothetical protein